MKKIFLMTAMLAVSAVVSAQTKPKSMRELRDSMFTVMKLSDESKKAMHDIIAESGKGQKDIREDASLSDEQRKEKLTEFLKNMRAREKSILTTEQQEMWKNFGEELKKKRNAG